MIFKQDGNGHCFLNCLKLYFNMRFALPVTLENVKKRFKYYMEKDIKFLMSFMPDIGTNPSHAIIILREKQNDYFEKRLYDNDFTDILINRCTKYFGFKLVIVEARENCIDILPLETDKAYDSDEYQFFENEMIVVLRTSGSHYDLIYPV